MLLAFLQSDTCLLWNPNLLYFQALGYGAMALVCFILAGLLLNIQGAQKDRLGSLRPVLRSGAAFLIICGIHSTGEMWTNWSPSPWLQAAGYELIAVSGGYAAWRIQQWMSSGLPARSDLYDFQEFLEQDPLTGIPNRRGMEAAFKHLQGYYNSRNLQHTLLLIDLDGLQRVNDRYGPCAGDTVLLQVAQTLNDSTRALDTVARVGEDEFIVLLAGCPPERGLTVAESLRGEIAKMQLPGIDSSASLVTASIGLAPFTTHDALETCLQQAERALQQAKQGGKNRVASPPSAPLLPLSMAYEPAEICSIASDETPLGIVNHHRTTDPVTEF